ncbi:MAG: hypothetical protein GKR77_07315, partial [Legionellales bacterium]|nr:hypothetical protein [Legionellales bacterium]
YSELSKQVTEQLFAETGVESGTFTLDGSTVIWGKLGDTITLTVYDVDGDVTTITIPVGSLTAALKAREDGIRYRHRERDYQGYRIGKQKGKGYIIRFEDL